MQYASGAYCMVFWGASILWDLFTISITISIIIVMLAIGQHEHWRTPGELSIVFLILFMYNFAMNPIICLLSLVFSKPTTGMNVLSIANMVLRKYFCFCFVFFFNSYPSSLFKLKFKKKKISSFICSISVLVFGLNIVMDFLHKSIVYILWSFPLCTMMDSIFKLIQIHTNELRCELSCKIAYNAAKCDWDKYCAVDPSCCGNLKGLNSSIFMCPNRFFAAISLTKKKKEN